MKSNSDHFQSTLIIFGIFFLITIIVSLFVDLEDRVYYFITLAIGTTAGLFKLYSGKKVKYISIGETSVEIWQYCRPFKLNKYSYKLDELRWLKTMELTGQLSRSLKLYAKSLDDKVKFVVTTELFLWSENEVEKIIAKLKEKGIKIQEF